MQLDNPAIYECPKGKSGLHTWVLAEDRTATCRCCNLWINREHTYDVFEGRFSERDEAAFRAGHRAR